MLLIVVGVLMMLAGLLLALANRSALRPADARDPATPGH
jgi:hypothetical protein